MCYFLLLLFESFSLLIRNSFFHFWFLFSFLYLFSGSVFLLYQKLGHCLSDHRVSIKHCLSLVYLSRCSVLQHTPTHTHGIERKKEREEEIRIDFVWFRGIVIDSENGVAFKSLFTIFGRRCCCCCCVVGG